MEFLIITVIKRNGVSPHLFLIVPDFIRIRKH
jgi:hypothetical protein